MPLKFQWSPSSSCVVKCVTRLDLYACGEVNYSVSLARARVSHAVAVVCLNVSVSVSHIGSRFGPRHDANDSTIRIGMVTHCQIGQRAIRKLDTTQGMERQGKERGAGASATNDTNYVVTASLQ